MHVSLFNSKRKILQVPGAQYAWIRRSQAACLLAWLWSARGYRDLHVLHVGKAVGCRKYGSRGLKHAPRTCRRHLLSWITGQDWAYQQVSGLLVSVLLLQISGGLGSPVLIILCIYMGLVARQVLYPQATQFI